MWTPFGIARIRMSLLVFIFITWKIFVIYMAPDSFPSSLNNQFMVFACWYCHMILTSPNYDHIHGKLLFCDSISCTGVNEALLWFYQTTLTVRLFPVSIPYYSTSQGFEVASSFHVCRYICHLTRTIIFPPDKGWLAFMYYDIALCSIFLQLADPH